MNFFEVMFARSMSSGSGGGSAPLNFSTEEQDTGSKWIDGSPIYCITFDRSENPVGSTGTLDVSTLNIGTLIDAALTRDIQNTTAQVSIGTGGCGVYILNDDLVYYSAEGGMMTYCTIWYTKAAEEPAEEEPAEAK